MRILKSIALFFLLLLAQSIYAEELFTVVITQNCSVKNTAVTELKAGQKLNTGDKVVVPGNAYLGLIHKNGKTVELNRTGVYSIDSIAKKIINPVDTLSISIFNFYTKVTQPYKKPNMSSTASMQWGTFRLNQNYRTLVYPDSIYMQWLPIDGAKGYTIELATMFDETVNTNTTVTNSISIDLSKINQSILEEHSVKIVLYATNNETLKSDDSYFLTFIPINEQVEIKNQINLIKKINPESTLLNDLLVAAYFEQKRLYLNAMQYYRRAAIKEKNSIAYQNVITEFLKRNDLYISE